MNVTLAQTENAVAMDDASKQDAVTIAITRDSKVYLGQDQISHRRSGAEGCDLLENKTDKMVYFRVRCTRALWHGRWTRLTRCARLEWKRSVC